jgi:outer membrane biosynthesis protein TonB
LKAASVKRFNEKHAVLQAIKMKEEEIRQKAEEEEKERAAQQQQQQQQQEAESEAAAKATKAAAAAKAAKEKEEREKKEKEEKARKEREKKEKEEKEKAKQMLQPPPQQSPAKSPRVQTTLHMCECSLIAVNAISHPSLRETGGHCEKGVGAGCGDFGRKHHPGSPAEDQGSRACRQAAAHHQEPC